MRTEKCLTKPQRTLAKMKLSRQSIDITQRFRKHLRSYTPYISDYMWGTGRKKRWRKT